MLLNAPQYGLLAQTVSGRIGGGVGPYTVTVYIIAPDNSYGSNGTMTFTPTVQADGTWTLNAAITGDPYFGCAYQGLWRAYFEITDSRGTNIQSTSITWAVSFPKVHAIP
jgi:hypothetical protein